MSATPVCPSSIGMAGPVEVKRDFGLTYPQSGGYNLATGADDNCMSYPQPTSLTATTTTCFVNPAPSPRLVVHQNTLGYTYSIAASDASSKVARVNVAGFRSTAQCFPDGSSSAVIDDSGSTLQLADPGTLSTTAQTEKVGSVVVGGTATAVVVKGDTAPSDALTAPDALDTWITDGRQPSGDWTTFTSTYPTSDGWRWAAINQKTGTVVYIR